MILDLHLELQSDFILEPVPIVEQILHQRSDAVGVDAVLDARLGAIATRLLESLRELLHALNEATFIVHVPSRDPLLRQLLDR